MTCDARATEACLGTLRLETRSGSRVTLIASGDFYVEAGQTDPVQVAMNAAGRRLLSRSSLVRATARATATDADGRAMSDSRAIVLARVGASTAGPKAIAVRTKTVRTAGRFAAIRVSCTRVAQGACSGTIALELVVKGKKTKLGGGGFLLDAGRSASVQTALTSRARTLLRQRKVINAVARVLVRDETGRRWTVSTRIVLRAR